jgi:succinate dehydrogenase hydrophobic anchor subunit
MLDFAKIKKWLLYILIASLVVSSLVAVTTVLIGEFNQTTTKAFFTLFSVIIHSLISLMFIWDDEKRKSLSKLSFFINTLFFIIVISFITTVFGIWEIVESETIAKLYITYFYIAIASLHADVLSKAQNKEKYIDIIIYANYIFITAVVLMLQPMIYIENAQKILGEVYYRIFGAVGIIDGTLSVLTIIFYKLYMHKHPELQDTQHHEKKVSGFMWFLIIIFILWILPMIFGLISKVLMKSF